MTSLDCNVYKLIDEYITKSDHNNNNNCNLNNNNCNNNNQNENNSSQLIDENNDFVGSLLLNCNIINTRTNMTTTTTTTTTTINNNNDDLTSNLKPNRPYSYYIATNMHPFDLSSNTQQLEDAINNLKLKQQEEEQENKKKQNEQQQQQKIRQRKKSASLKTPEKKLNRLSVSLTDLPPVTSTTGGDKSSLTQTPTLTGKKGNKKSKTAYSSHSSIIHNSKKYTLNHPTDDSEQEQSSLNTPKKSKINKFLKRLFSFKSTKQQQQQQPQNSKQSSSQKDIHQASTFNNTDDEHHHQPSSEDEQSTSSSKFTRFFSFRSSNKQTNKQQNNLIVTDIHQTTAATTTTTNNNKKSNEQTPNKENYLPDLVMKNNETDTSFVSSTELSYTEIADKLKRILNDKVKSQSQSSKYINDVNNNNIPFIDDDDVSICNSYDALNTSSSNRSNTHLNHDTTATTTSKTTPLSTTSNTDTTASSTPLSSTSRTNQQQQQQRPFSFLNSSNVEYILKKYNFPDELEKYLDENSSTPLDSTTFNYYTGWYQIALIFELIYHAIKYTGSMNSNNAADKLKLVATNYINDKYGNWINSYGGGWKSVPDSLSPSVKSGEIYSID